MSVVAPTDLSLHSSRDAQSRHDAVVRREERGRIARELHDSTSQLLVALQLNLACLKQSSENTSAQQVFCVLDQILHELHREVRAISTSGEAPSLPDSLPLALNVMATHFALLTNVKITLSVQGDYVSPSDEVEMSLYRIAQEALANVARHAEATEVRLKLDCQQRTLKLTIEDNGVGFRGRRGADLSGGGTGIENIRRRVSDMGGHLVLRQLHNGSRVAVTVHPSFLPAANAA